MDAVSPDYIDLELDDLDDEHVFIQRAHKLSAFQQWQRVIASHGVTDLRGKKVLDIGCGVGGFLEYTRDLGAKCYGFDASRAHVEVAQKNFPEVFHAESLSEYSMKLGRNEKFDLVTMWDVFEHIRKPEALLKEVSGQLTNEGLLYVSVPSGAMNKVKVQLARVRGRSEIGLIPWEHVFYYTPRSLRYRFTQAGLEVLEVSGVVPYERKVLNAHERTRRVVHHVLRSTPFALQIYGLAKRAG